MAKRRCILVLGAHRSGTSALTRVINLLGAALPQNLLPAYPGNKAGHWEPKRLLKLNDQMLAESGSRWDDWRKLDLAVLPSERLDFYKAEISRLIAEEYGDAQLIVLKEPRIGRFVPLYSGLLAELGYECLYVLTLRNPLAVIASLARRNGMTEGFAAFLWLRYVLDVEAATRAKPRVTVSYDALLADWQATIQDLSTRLGIELPRPIGDACDEITEFLSNDLRHFAPTRHELQARPDIVPWIRDTYEALLQGEPHPDGEPGHRVLDRVRDEFDTASFTFGAATIPELIERERKFRAERRLLADKIAQVRATISADEKDLQLAALEQEAIALTRPNDPEIPALNSRIAMSTAQASEPASPAEIDHSLAVPITDLIEQPLLNARTAVIIHIYYVDLAQEFRRYVENIPGRVDVFVSTCDELNKKIIEAAFSDWPNGTIDVRVTPNRGRDIAPKLLAFKDVHSAYEIVLHLHSKRSPHRTRLRPWRTFLLENMLGTREVATTVLQLFATMPSLGMVASQNFLHKNVTWGFNFSIAQQLANRMGIQLSESQVFDFPSGSMFWARTAALKPLLDLELNLEDFPHESGQTDGTLAHAIERLYFHVCERAGYDWIKISRPDLAVAQ